MSGSGIGQFIPLILIFVIFYFFLIRPQQKKVKEHKLMVEFLKQNRKDGIVEDKALELLKEVNEKYNNIYVSWGEPDENGNRYPKETPTPA